MRTLYFLSPAWYTSRRMDEHCPICDDAGFLMARDRGRGSIELCSCRLKSCACGGEKPYLLPSVEETEAEACPCRSERRELDRRRALHLTAGLPPLFAWVQLSDFKWRADTYPEELVPAAGGKAIFPHLQDIQMKLLSYLQEFDPADGRGFYLWGKPGGGKSLVCAILINELIRRAGIPARYLKINSGFLSRLKDAFSAGSGTAESAREIFDQAANAPFLVVDDFGVQQDTPWEQRTIYDLVDRRYEYRLPTVFSSNLPPHEFSGMFHGRVLSRLEAMTETIEFRLPDFRQLKKMRKDFR